MPWFRTFLSHQGTGCTAPKDAGRPFPAVLEEKPEAFPRSLEPPPCPSDLGLPPAMIPRPTVISAPSARERDFSLHRTTCDVLCLYNTGLSQREQRQLSICYHVIRISNRGQESPDNRRERTRGGFRRLGRGVGAVSSFVPNKANFRRFWAKNEDRAEKQSQSKPIRNGLPWASSRNARHNPPSQSRQTKPISTAAARAAEFVWRSAIRRCGRPGRGNRRRWGSGRRAARIRGSRPGCDRRCRPGSLRSWPRPGRC